MKTIIIQFNNESPRLHLLRQFLQQKFVEMAGEIRLLEEVELAGIRDSETTREPLNEPTPPASPASPCNGCKDKYSDGLPHVGAAMSIDIPVQEPPLVANAEVIS